MSLIQPLPSQGPREGWDCIRGASAGKATEGGPHASAMGLHCSGVLEAACSLWERRDGNEDSPQTLKYQKGTLTQKITI